MGKIVIFKIFVLAKRKIELESIQFVKSLSIFFCYNSFMFEEKQEILWANMPRVCKEISSSQHLWRNTAFFFGIILLLLPKWTDTWDGIFFLLMEWVNVVLIFWKVGLIWKIDWEKRTTTNPAMLVVVGNFEGGKMLEKSCVNPYLDLFENIIFLTNFDGF